MNLRLSINLGVKAEIIPLDTVKFEEYVLHNVYGEESKKQKTRIERSRYKQSTNLEPINPILDRLIKKIRLVNKQIGETQKEIRNIKRENMPSNQSTPSQMAVREVLLNAGQRITDAFIKISPSRSFVSHIEIVRGKISDVSLSAIVQLTNGKKASPVDIFSEANLDLLALLIYLSFAKEAAEKGQAKFLVLDDVLQSVDASIRLLVTEYIIQDFKDWQLVFTVHDRLWQEQLRALLRRLNHGFVEKEIVRWEPLTGPIIINVSRNDSTLLQEAMLSGDIFWICSQAGMLLEKIANALSISLQSSVTRRKDDKYTLGDLWPGVLKILKKTTLKETVEETDRWMHLRNLIGAHFNEWAQTLSRQEAQLFGESVIKLYERTYCFTCYKIVEQVSNNSKWQCRCGGIVIL